MNIIFLKGFICLFNLLFFIVINIHYIFCIAAKNLNILEIENVHYITINFCFCLKIIILKQQFFFIW